jgi:hypothetical protein
VKLAGALLSVAIWACASGAGQAQPVADPPSAAAIGCVTARSRTDVLALAERLQLPVISGGDQLTAAFPPEQPVTGTHVDTIAVAWALGGYRQTLEYVAFRIQGGNFSTVQYGCNIRTRIVDAAAFARTLQSRATGPISASLSEGGYLLVVHARLGHSDTMVSFRFDDPIGGVARTPRGSAEASPTLDAYIGRLGRPALISFANRALGPPT